MSYSANFKIPDSNSQLFSAVISEKEDLKTNRATVTISYSDKFCIFDVEASDFASYRAMTNAVLRLITIHHKMSELAK